MNDHIHIWQTNFEVIECVGESYCCASGMFCKCGLRMGQSQVEQAINTLEQLAVDPALSPDANSYAALVGLGRENDFGEER